MSDEESEAGSDEETAAMMYDGSEGEEEEPGTDEDDGDVPGATRGGRGGRGCGRGSRGTARGRGRGGAAAGGVNAAAWVTAGIDIAMPAFTAATGKVPPPPGTEYEHPVDLFLTPDILLQIRVHTNRRAHIELAAPTPPAALTNWRDVSQPELYAFLAILIVMGLHNVPEESDYWSTSDYLGVPAVGRLMARNRFKQIKHCLMVANPTAEENAADRLAKVRPFLNMVNTVSQLRYRPHQDLSLDESQCQCGHRHARFSFRGETKKPIADYIKVISLHCAHCGYCYNFQVDTRQQTVSEMVSAVCAPLPPQPFRIATDRFYTSVRNARTLLERGLFMYGTVRTDRGVDKTLLTPGALEDGQSRWSMAPPSLLCCVWRDTSATGVWFLSTCHDGRVAEGTVQRRKRGSATVTKPAPQVAIDYNRNMGGCDRANSLRASYLTHKRRWYMTMFYYGLDVLLVNAFIYANDGLPPAEQLTHKKFRLALVALFASRALAGGAAATANGGGQIKRLRREELPASRLVGHHRMVKLDKQRGCVWCYKTLGRQIKASYSCDLCCVCLHAECFHMWHDPAATI
jgi:hypothetical protein